LIGVLQYHREWSRAAVSIPMVLVIGRRRPYHRGGITTDLFF
jgi:hypothetical protein